MVDRSLEQVELNKWHRADISRINRAGTLIVDNQPPVRGRSGVRYQSPVRVTQG